MLLHESKTQKHLCIIQQVQRVSHFLTGKHFEEEYLIAKVTGISVDRLEGFAELFLCDSYCLGQMLFLARIMRSQVLCYL